MATTVKGSLKEPVINSNGYGYTISWEGGGEVPAALSGMYTSPTEAHKSIEKYMRTRRKPKNAKASDRAE